MPENKEFKEWKSYWWDIYGSHETPYFKDFQRIEREFLVYAKQGSVKHLKFLMDSFKPYNCFFKKGKALKLAIKNGHQDAMIFLIEQGVDRSKIKDKDFKAHPELKIMFNFMNNAKGFIEDMDKKRTENLVAKMKKTYTNRLKKK